MDVFRALVLMRKEDPFDIIFMDPPYGRQLEQKALAVLADSPLATKDTLFVVEVSLDTPLDWLAEYGYRLERLKEYKTNGHAFIRRER